MSKFNVKFQRDFEVGIEADDVATADKLARSVLAQFPEGTCKVLSVVAEGADMEKPCAECEAHGPIKPHTHRPTNNPSSGGSPGTPTIRVPELVDQIASAA